MVNMLILNVLNIKLINYFKDMGFLFKKYFKSVVNSGVLVIEIMVFIVMFDKCIEL